MPSRTRTAVPVSIQERRILRSSTRIDEEQVALVMEDESDLTPLEDEVPKQPPHARRKKATPKMVAVEDEQVPNVSMSRGARKRTQIVDNAEDEPGVPSNKRKRACKPEPVYIIPDVEKKQTTFRGRLGIAFATYLIFARLTLLCRICLFKHRPTEYEARERDHILFQNMSVSHIMTGRNSLSYLAGIELTLSRRMVLIGSRISVDRMQKTY